MHCIIKSIMYLLLTSHKKHFIIYITPYTASLVAQMVKCLSAMQETRVRSLGWEDSQEKEMAAHSSILAWKMPWTSEPSRLLFMGSHRVGTRLSKFTSLHCKTCRVLVPQPGIKAMPLHWKRGVLTTATPGDSSTFFENSYCA